MRRSNNVNHSGGGHAPAVLLNLSGGIDSALCMYEALKAGRRLLVHHIRLTSWEGRADVEDEAVEKICAWHREQGFSFEYTHSAFDYGNLPYIVKDVCVWSFLTAVILADPRRAKIRTVIVPRHRESFGVLDSASGPQRSNDLLNGLSRLVARRIPALEFPIGHLTKAEIIDRTPPDLLKLCWWCRKPQDGRPCHRCMTCKQVDPILENAHGTLSRKSENRRDLRQHRASA